LEWRNVLLQAKGQDNIFAVIENAAKSSVNVKYALYLSDIRGSRIAMNCWKTIQAVDRP
jgi:uncharacterized protein YcfL